MYEESVELLNKVENIIVNCKNKSELNKHLVNTRYERTSTYFMFKDPNFC